MPHAHCADSSSIGCAFPMSSAVASGAVCTSKVIGKTISRTSHARTHTHTRTHTHAHTHTHMRGWRCVHKQGHWLNCQQNVTRTHKHARAHTHTHIHTHTHTSTCLLLLCRFRPGATKHRYHTRRSGRTCCCVIGSGLVHHIKTHQ